MGGGRNSIDNCSLALLITLVAVVASGFNWNTRVTTKFGDIKGLWSRSSRGRLVAHYLGIPYARPPLGDLRFRVSLLYSFSFFFFFLHRGYDREFLEKYFRVPGSVEQTFRYVKNIEGDSINKKNVFYISRVFFFLDDNSVTEPSAMGSKVERDLRSYEKQPIVLSDVKGWEHDWRRGLSLSQYLRTKSKCEERKM